MGDDSDWKTGAWPPRVLGLVLCGVLGLIGTFSTAQAQADAPLANQPTSHFYQAQGSSIKVSWLVEPQTIPEDGELVATLVITGAANPQSIVRPNLKKLEEFQTRFVITDQADPPPTAQSAEVRFSYRLRPRNRSVERVPMLEFYYYNPSAAAGKAQFPKAIARGVPIRVTEAPQVEPPAIPLNEPERLFVIATGPQLLKKDSPAASWIWIAAGLLGPLAAIVWYVVWQRLFPDAARQARLRRSVAARRAVDAIRRAGHAADPTAELAATMLAYLRARYSLPPGTDTPGEIEAALSAQQVNPLDCLALARFFRDCDAARFAPTSQGHVSLAGDGELLITRLEEGA